MPKKLNFPVKNREEKREKRRRRKKVGSFDEKIEFLRENPELKELLKNSLETLQLG